MSPLAPALVAVGAAFALFAQRSPMASGNGSEAPTRIGGRGGAYSYHVALRPQPPAGTPMLACLTHFSPEDAAYRDERRASFRQGPSEIAFEVPEHGRLTLGVGCGCSCPDWLELWTADGLWAGGTRLETGREWDGSTLAVDLEPFGALRVRAVSPSGERVEPMTCRVRPLAGVGLERDRPDDLERSLFRFLDEGAYTVRVKGRRHYEATATVFVAAGSVTETTLSLDPAPIAGDVAGTLSTASGRGLPFAYVSVEGLEPPHFFDEVEVQWVERLGRTVGTWRVHDVPRGRCRVELSTGGQYPWDRMQADTFAPDLNVDFACDDSAPCADLGLRIVDATSDETIPEAVVYWTQRGWEERKAIEPAGGRPVQRIVEAWPLNAAFDYTVAAPGYRLGHGTVADFRFAESTPDGPVLVARVALQPGGELDLRIVDEASEPVRGVDVLVGGRVAGRSDADGRVQVLADLGRDRFEFAGRGRRWSPDLWHFDEHGRFDPDDWDRQPIEVTVETARPR